MQIGSPTGAQQCLAGKSRFIITVTTFSVITAVVDGGGGVVVV
jgi:hypothetical protein